MAKSTTERQADSAAALIQQRAREATKERTHINVDAAALQHDSEVASDLIIKQAADAGKLLHHQADETGELVQQQAKDANILLHTQANKASELVKDQVARRKHKL
jgi:hypothetical protein